MLFFSSIKNYILGGLAILTAIFFGLFKYQKAKSDKIEIEKKKVEGENVILTNINNSNEEIRQEKVKKDKEVKETEINIQNSKPDYKVSQDDKLKKEYKFGEF